MSKMYDIQRDAAFVIMAKAAKDGDWLCETFLATYKKDRANLTFVLGQLGIIKRIPSDSYVSSYYEWC